MDFGKAFSYVFDDAGWVRKILLTALILLIPIVGQLYLYGWMLEISRRVIRHDPYPLPDVDVSGYLSTGFKAFVVSLVYSLPALLISGVLNLAIAVIDPGNNGNAANGVVVVLSLCLGLFSFVYGIAMSFMIYAALGNLAAKGNISDGLRFREVFGLLKAAPGAYIIAVLGALAAYLVAMLGLIACFIGVIVTVTYASAVSAHLIGQAYNQAAGAVVPSQPRVQQGW